MRHHHILLSTSLALTMAMSLHQLLNTSLRTAQSTSFHLLQYMSQRQHTNLQQHHLQPNQQLKQPTRKKRGFTNLVHLLPHKIFHPPTRTKALQLKSWQNTRSCRVGCSYTQGSIYVCYPPSLPLPASFIFPLPLPLPLSFPSPPSSASLFPLLTINNRARHANP